MMLIVLGHDMLQSSRLPVLVGSFDRAPLEEAWNSSLVIKPNVKELCLGDFCFCLEWVALHGVSDLPPRSWRSLDNSRID